MRFTTLNLSTKKELPADAVVTSHQLMLRAGLIRKLTEGDSVAFGELYDRTSPTVFGLLARMLGDRAVAEEVTQEVYIEYWRTSGSFDPTRGSGLGWMTMIARSRAIDRKRSQASYDRSLHRLKERPDAQPLSTPLPRPDESAHIAEQRARLVGALGTLSPEQRRAIELAFFEGLSHSEIAEVAGIPLGTVKSRMRTALGRMKDALGPESAERARGRSI